MKRRAEFTVHVERRDVAKDKPLRWLIDDIEAAIKKAVPGARVTVTHAEVEIPQSK